ncbi:hypothetical protein ABID22_004108 [Pontibacter aydingkolensis]
MKYSARADFSSQHKGFPVFLLYLKSGNFVGMQQL